MYRVFIGLGSNMGDRHRFLQRAADEIRSLPDTLVVWYSSVYEAEPYGKADQPRFLNAAGELTTALAPDDLLVRLKAIETKVGRQGREHWGPREIDLDILLYDGLVVQTDAVSVPHPDLAHRRFVLVPLREIAADLVHPVSGMTVSELAAACSDQGRVVKTSYHVAP
jgi:2-amino-4-hydroxy-6-hydroxymethyldihydropteridine diphosphokinase